MKILRTIGILALVAGLLLGSAGSVLATPPDEPRGGSQHSPGKPHGLFGEISDLDEDAETFILTTRQGEEVPVTATSATRYKVPGIPPSSDITTIGNGDWVAMNGTWDDDNFCPKRVHVVPGKGVNFHFVGTVTGKGEGTIVVYCKKLEDSITFSVNVDTKYRPAEGEDCATDFDDIDIDDTVTVVAREWDVTAKTATAKAIVLHGHEPDAQGPITSSVSAQPNPTAGANEVILTANIDDSTTCGSDIAEAEYFIDTVGSDGAGESMTASDGTLDSVTEGVTATIDVSTWGTGSYTLYVHGKDAAGNWGATASVVLQVTV